jgi:hypothetical protein
MTILPQILMIVWLALGLGVGLALHGKVVSEPKNFGHSVVATTVIAALLYWGGFFDVLFK